MVEKCSYTIFFLKKKLFFNLIQVKGFELALYYPHPLKHYQIMLVILDCLQFLYFH